MKDNNYFVRNIDAIYHLEIFLVCSVAAVLTIRLFLHLTGYPQIGNSTLHIAHMLWGGLLMLVALIMLFAFFGKRIELLAAILGGIGFGTFIDEVGKFVTQDNDYFFQPAVSLMYITFILIIIAMHIIKSAWTLTEKEYLLNALKGLEEVALKDLDLEEKNKVLLYLEKSDSNDALAQAIMEVITKSELVPVKKPGLLLRIKDGISGFYAKMAAYRYFRWSVILFFLVKLLLTVGFLTLMTFFIGFGVERVDDMRFFDQLADRLQNLSFVNKAEYFSSLLSGVFVILGAYYFYKSRLIAYQMFERSVLISILLTYVFVFYEKQFAALAGLTFNILILIALKIMIREEEIKKTTEKRATA